mgnify:CR=1 FL=1
MTESAVLDRVRKLLALATSSNAHEAAAAAARAQALIEAHRLQTWLDAEATQGDDVDPIIDARDAPLVTSKRLRKWKVVLAVALAEANGCVAYTLVHSGESSIVLVGRSRDRAAVGTLWDWLVKQIEWLSATHGAGRSRKWHEAFRIGVVSAVSERLAAAVHETRAAVESTSLIRIDPARAAHEQALNRFVDQNLRLGKGRSIRLDGDAWRTGRAASAALKLP